MSYRRQIWPGSAGRSGVGSPSSAPSPPVGSSSGAARRVLAGSIAGPRPALVLALEVFRLGPCARRLRGTSPPISNVENRAMRRFIARGLLAGLAGVESDE